MHLKSPDEIESSAAAIAHTNRLSMRCFYVFMLMAIVFIVLAGFLLFSEEPSRGAFYRCMGAAFLCEGVSLLLGFGITMRTRQTLLCNNCDCATYRRVMQLQIPMPEFKRQVPSLMLNVLVESITLGDKDGAYAAVESLENMRDKLKPTQQFALDLHKATLAIINAGNNADLIIKARSELVQRWPKPPKKSDEKMLVSFLNNTDLRGFGATRDWTSFGTALTRLPVRSVFEECNYHMLRAAWCEGTGVSPVPDYTFVAEHGGDMAFAREARRALAALPEQERTLSADQIIPSKAPRIEPSLKVRRFTTIVFLAAALIYYLLAFRV